MLGSAVAEVYIRNYVNWKVAVKTHADIRYFGPAHGLLGALELA